MALPMIKTGKTPQHRLVTIFVGTYFTGLFILCLISAALIALNPNVYICEAAVDIGSGPAAPAGSLRQRVFTEMRVMSSPQLLKRVVQDLHLVDVWGKRYNNGVPLSSGDSLKMLEERMDIRAPRDTSKIIIRVLDVSPAEAAGIANSVLQNYRDYFTASRGISPKILEWAQPQGKIVHTQWLFHLPRVLGRSVIFAVPIAVAVWGIAFARMRAARMPPPIPGAETAPRRFEKY